MLELGAEEREMHREVGGEIALLGIDVLWGVRGLAAEIVAAGREQGMTTTRFFETSEAAAAAALEEVRAGDLVLVKGSRSVATDKIVAALRERFALVGEDNR